MRLGLFVVVVFLSLVDISGGGGGGNKALKGKRQRRSVGCGVRRLRCAETEVVQTQCGYRFDAITCVSTEMNHGCAKGCDLCSEFNGCLRCSPKLFILLERNDIRQIGICLPSCPLGYFDVRNPYMNKCIKCKIENCEACFSRNFCTKCKEGLYLHKGKCYTTCPEGYSAANGTMECSSPAQCEMGEWSAWSPCSKRGKLCGFKRGSQERSRMILPALSADVAVCPPPTRELRKCTVQRIPCTEVRIKDKEEQSKRVNRNRKDGKEGRSGSKRRKIPPRGTVVPVTSPP